MWNTLSTLKRTAAGAVLAGVSNFVKTSILMETSNGVHAMQQAGSLKFPNWMGGRQTSPAASEIQVADGRLRLVKTGTGHEAFLVIPRHSRWGQITHDFYIFKFDEKSTLRHLLRKQAKTKKTALDPEIYTDYAWDRAVLLMRHSVALTRDQDQSKIMEWEFYVARDDNDPGFGFKMHFQWEADEAPNLEMKVALELSSDDEGRSEGDETPSFSHSSSNSTTPADLLENLTLSGTDVGSPVSGADPFDLPGPAGAAAHVKAEFGHGIE